MSRPSAAIVLPTIGLISSLAVVLWAGLARLGVDPVFQLGVSLSLILTFGLIWCFGVRYPDVGWMVVIAALLALKAAVRPETLTGEAAALFGAFELATMLAFAGFLLTFFRIPLPPGRIELAFASSVVAYGALLLIIPDAFVREWELVQAVPRYAGAVLLGYATVHGILTLKPLPPKRRRYVAAVTATAVLATACYLVSARWIADGRTLTTPLLDHAFAMTLSVFLLADLVVFHRNYVKDKASRIARLDDEVAKETQRELARGMRGLMTDVPASGVFEDFRYEWHRVGDGNNWHEAWRLQGELRLLFGDIEAPGALAPLVATAIRALLLEAKDRALSFDATARHLNGRLLDLFGHMLGRRIRATLFGVSLGADGSAEVFNAGGVGFFLASRDGGRHLPLNSTPLGLAAELELAHEPVPLEDGDVLFAAGHALLPDAAGIRRLMDFFDEAMDFTPSLDGIKQEVLKLSPSAGADQLMLVIERTRPAIQPLAKPG